MGKLIESNVPMWEIDGNNKLDEYAAIIAELSIEIKSTEIELYELNKEIESNHHRINMYIGNTLGILDYEHLDHVLVVNDNMEIMLYPSSILDTIAGNFDDLPESDQVFSISKQKVKKIVDLLYGYNDLIDSFEELSTEFKIATKEHKRAWEEVKKIVHNINYLRIYENKDIIEEEEDFEDVEQFNNDVHTLIIAQSDDEQWGFRYIRKEDEQTFNEYVSNLLDEEKFNDEDE